MSGGASGGRPSGKGARSVVQRAGEPVDERGAATVSGEWLKVESLDLDGQGIAHDAAGKVMFIEGALIGEEVRMRVTRSKNNWAKGEMTAMRHASSQRVVPACPHFGVCGGCKIQHLDAGAQMAVKQRALEDALWHVGKVKPAIVLRPISGPAWAYRQRARLALFYLARERRMLIGFHESKSSHVADIDVCPVMPRAMSELLGPLHALMMAMEHRARLPQIEVAIGDDLVALVLRHLVPIGQADLDRLREFSLRHGVQWWLQPQGPESARLLDMGVPGNKGQAGSPAEARAETRRLAYTLPEFGIRMPYRPTDFTQVNPAMNRALVRRALQLLSPEAGDRVIDWFCGMGNFTLPIARTAGQVLGIEGSATLVAQARSNAALHGLDSTVRFALADLFETTPEALAAFGVAEKWLLDPPRDGAFALVKSLVALRDDPSLAPAFRLPSRIVYVSCDPSTLARDAGLLVHRAGYRCTAAGAVDMFPQTAHVESIAVFDRP